MSRDWSDVLLKVQDLVGEQTTTWSAMVARQLLEEHTLLKSHIEQQHELLTRLMQEFRDVQIKELEVRHDRYVYGLALFSMIFRQVIVCKTSSTFE